VLLPSAEAMIRDSFIGQTASYAYTHTTPRQMMKRTQLHVCACRVCVCACRVCRVCVCACVRVMCACVCVRALHMDMFITHSHGSARVL